MSLTNVRIGIVCVRFSGRLGWYRWWQQTDARSTTPISQILSSRTVGKLSVFSRVVVGGGVVVVVVGGRVVVVCFFLDFLSLLGFLVALGSFGSLFFFLSFFFFFSSFGALLTLPRSPGHRRREKSGKKFFKICWLGLVSCWSPSHTC